MPHEAPSMEGWCKECKTDRPLTWLFKATRNDGSEYSKYTCNECGHDVIVQIRKPRSAWSNSNEDGH
jgi:hypothetical protein